MFDSGKSGHIEKEKVRTILNTLGHTFDDLELEALLEEQDKEGMFVCWCARAENLLRRWNETHVPKHNFPRQLLIPAESKLPNNKFYRVK